MWETVYARTFLKDYERLPKSARERVKRIIVGEEILQDPFLEGKTIKLQGYEDYYRIRVGEYRIGLRLDFDHHLIEFRRVLHRNQIYRRFP
jgi:mRNA interferase RelE/StbE